MEKYINGLRDKIIDKVENLNEERMIEESYTGVVTGFLGYVKGVKIDDSHFYVSTVYIMDYIKEVTGRDVSYDLVESYVYSVNRSYLKDSYFSLSEIEEESSNVINGNIKDLGSTNLRYMRSFYEDYHKWLG